MIVQTGSLGLLAVLVLYEMPRQRREFLEATKAQRHDSITALATHDTKHMAAMEKMADSIERHTRAVETMTRALIGRER